VVFEKTLVVRTDPTSKMPYRKGEMENSWVDDYYDTLDFPCWEPHHFGRK
jgi:hypothetical protein